MYNIIKSLLVHVKTIVNKIRKNSKSKSSSNENEEKNVEVLACGGIISLQILCVFTGLCNLLFLGLGIIPLIMCPGFLMAVQVKEDRIFQGIIVRSLFIGGIIYGIVAAIFTLYFIVKALFSKLKLSISYIEAAITNGILIIPSCVALVTMAYNASIEREGIRIIQYVIGILISSGFNLYFLVIVYYFSRQLDYDVEEEEDSLSMSEIEITIYEPKSLESDNQTNLPVSV